VRFLKIFFFSPFAFGVRGNSDFYIFTLPLFFWVVGLQFFPHPHCSSTFLAGVVLSADVMSLTLAPGSRDRVVPFSSDSVFVGTF